MSNLIDSEAPVGRRRPFAALGPFALALAAITCGMGGVCRAQGSLEDVRVGFEGRYKVGTWTPIRALVKAGAAGFSGTFDVITPDEDGIPATVRQPVQVGPNATVRVTSYARPASMSTTLATLRLVDGKTGQPSGSEVVVDSFSSTIAADTLEGSDYSIVAVGNPSGVEVIPSLPGYNAKRSNPDTTGRAREVSVARLADPASLDALPGRWYGFDGVDAVVLDTGDLETLKALGSGRLDALRRWVERGGHLVVAVSRNWQAVNDSPVASMLPARVSGQSQVNPFEALESYAGATQQANAENAPVQVGKLEDVEARGGRVIASTLSTPLVVRGPLGFGRVTLVTVDVDTKPFASWRDRARFWLKALDLKAPSGGLEAASTSGRRIISLDVSDLSTLLRRSLDHFPGVAVIPFGWVAAFIAVYILLIGPGDYFFLKKVVKRMELTWVTFPIIVASVCGLAYVAASRIKGTEIRVNQVDVVDVDLTARSARGTTWVNVFSPRNRDYGVGVVPTRLAADPLAAGKPALGADVVLSWFAAPETGLRGTMNRGGAGVGGHGYAYEPAGSLQKLDGVRIGVWSSKAFVARWAGPAPDAGSILDVDIQPVGTDRLAGTIRNNLDVPLKDTIIAFGRQVYYNVGTIGPGATIQVDRAYDRALSRFLQEQRAGYYPEHGDILTGGQIDRGDLVRGMMFHDSDASAADLISNQSGRDLDLTAQLALGRPMLVAEVDRFAPELSLVEDDNAAEPRKPSLTRSTVLRVILPLKEPAAR